MVIGIYYVFWVVFQLLPIFLLLEAASKLFSIEITDMPGVIRLMWASGVCGLLMHGLSLLDFNAKMASANQTQISHKVRSYYINPLVTVLLSFIVGMGIWFFAEAGVIPSQEGGIVTLFAAIIGLVSMQISSKLEELMFRDFRERRGKTA